MRLGHKDTSRKSVIGVHQTEATSRATPLEFLCLTRLAEARRQLSQAEPAATVTSIAINCGFTHLGRFAGWYRERYGESPSATLDKARQFDEAISPPTLLPQLDRPSIAVLPFDLIGPAAASAIALQDEIAAALCATRWFSVLDPSQARYHLRGKVRDDGNGRLHFAVVLLDKAGERYLFADTWGGDVGELFGFEDRLANRLASALRTGVRDAEIARARRRDPAQLTAWELSMRALGSLMLAERLMPGTTLELLEEAMELAPQDPLPIALAAWCHSVRASHHQTSRPDDERWAASQLAARAGPLTNHDPAVETMLCTAYTLAQELDAASILADRALNDDPGLSWAWGRSAWIHVYRGKPTIAIERFNIALALAPRDPLRYLWSMGIASAHFDAARYREAVRWSRRALIEQPRATTIHRLLAPSCVFADAKQEAQQSFDQIKRCLPGLTVGEVTAALPLTSDHLDRRAEGLEHLGMRLS
jgi:adenylate cyclase